MLIGQQKTVRSKQMTRDKLNLWALPWFLSSSGWKEGTAMTDLEFWDTWAPAGWPFVFSLTLFYYSSNWSCLISSYGKEMLDSHELILVREKSIQWQLLGPLTFEPIAGQSIGHWMLGLEPWNPGRVHYSGKPCGHLPIRASPAFLLLRLLPTSSHLPSFFS